MAFHDVQFPTDISYGATGGPSYRTTVITTASGFEQRLQEWDTSLMKWTIAADFWNKSRLDQLVAFFHARAGRAYAFRFKDWSDYYVGLIAGTLAYDVTTAQQFGTGDGSATVFQLTRSYTSGSTTRVRKITRPVAGSVKVYFGSTEQTSGWSIDNSTGLVTFATAPSNTTVIKWAGQFDVPVRFDTDDMALNIESIQVGNWSGVQIVGIKE